MRPDQVPARVMARLRSELYVPLRGVRTDAEIAAHVEKIDLPGLMEVMRRMSDMADDPLLMRSMVLLSQDATHTTAFAYSLGEPEGVRPCAIILTECGGVVAVSDGFHLRAHRLRNPLEALQKESEKVRWLDMPVAVASTLASIYDKLGVDSADLARGFDCHIERGSVGSYVLYWSRHERESDFNSLWDITKKMISPEETIYLILTKTAFAMITEDGRAIQFGIPAKEYSHDEGHD